MFAICVVKAIVPEVLCFFQMYLSEVRLSFTDVARVSSNKHLYENINFIYPQKMSALMASCV